MTEQRYQAVLAVIPHAVELGSAVFLCRTCPDLVTSTKFGQLNERIPEDASGSLRSVARRIIDLNSGSAKLLTQPETTRTVAAARVGRTRPAMPGRSQQRRLR